MDPRLSASWDLAHRLHEPRRRSGLAVFLLLMAVGAVSTSEPSLAQSTTAAQPSEADADSELRENGSSEPAPSTSPPCPSDMVHTRGYCIDRYEASMVDNDTGQPLSPYYPPHPLRMRWLFFRWDQERRELGPEGARAMPLPAISRWQRENDFHARAVSQPGVVPQAYVSRELAEQACNNAGKRLCTSEEWVLACRGRWSTHYPYGNRFQRTACNVYRYLHPASVLHGIASVGQLDPRLNLIVTDDDEPVLRDTGASPRCKSPWWDDAVYDMVGNLDEWVADGRGVFRGGFYARPTNRGCSAMVSSHSPDYFDYSTGVRCCQDATASDGSQTPGDPSQQD